MLHTIYQDSISCGFRQEIFMFFLFMPIDVKYVTLGRAIFGSHGHNLNKLGRGPLLDAKYQLSRLSILWFQTRFFHAFPIIISQCYACEPQGGSIFGPRAIISINLVEVYQIMLHTKYQGYALWFQIRRVFKFSSCQSIYFFRLCDLDYATD